MGKSETARTFASLGCPVFDADTEVHRLLDDPAVAAEVALLFPDCVPGGRVDRSRLARLFDVRADAVDGLETILHPRVRDGARRFVETARAGGAPLAVLEIPLLYETGSDAACDAVVVVTAPAAVQRARTLSRRGMTPARFEAILARQLPDRAKRARADFVIDTSGDTGQLARDVAKVVAALGLSPPAAPA